MPLDLYLKVNSVFCFSIKQVEQIISSQNENNTTYKADRNISMMTYRLNGRRPSLYKRLILDRTQVGQ
jgi:hypothetical protein